MGLLAARLLPLDPRVLGLQLGPVHDSHSLLQHRLLPLLIRHPGAEELGRAGDDLSDLGVFGRAGPKGLLLVLRVQETTHAEYLPVSLELGREVRLGQIEPIRAGVVLETWSLG